jgi:hypothetical protein
MLFRQTGPLLSLAYADGFALVAIVFWVAILPALWMRPKN